MEKEPQREWGTLGPTVGPGSSAGLANVITAAANVCSPATDTYTSLTSSCSLMARWWIPTTHHLSGWATVLLSPCCIFYTFIFFGPLTTTLHLRQGLEMRNHKSRCWTFREDILGFFVVNYTLFSAGKYLTTECSCSCVMVCRAKKLRRWSSSLLERSTHKSFTGALQHLSCNHLNLQHQK